MLTALPALPPLSNTPPTVGVTPNYAPIGGGTGGSGGSTTSGWPPIGPIITGIGGAISTGLGGVVPGAGSVLPAAFNATSAALSSQGCSWIDVFCLAKTQLVRFLLLILGIVFIIGAIYLYKPANQTFIAPVVKGAKGVAKHAAETAALAS